MGNSNLGGSGFELELLRLIAGAAEGTVAGMPPGIVRFTLELPPGANPDDLKTKLVTLLGAESFTLEPLAAKAPEFVVLQFPGVRRTIAPPRLFAVASYLVDELGLVSCVPDIGSTVYAEPDARLLHDDVPESVITNAFCWSDAAVPTDTRWALNKIGAVEAWSLPNGRGEGVIVAQPDTGVAQHAELEAGSLALDKAANILEGGNDPTDPLREGTANPGHGTATSSTVVSRAQGSMTGSAPLAQLVPIRCIEDVKIFDGAPVARAILHAVSIKADVISMSLGGIYSPSIAAAVRQAVAADCIVLAASGNCVGFVVYPASDRNVISLGGTDIGDKPWKGTSRGSRVDISAPAENVFVARRTPGDDGKGIVAGGQGTSFATALTAGVAATWISHFTRDNIRAEAKKRSISVQELFRAALKATVRTPDGWQRRLNGAGIIDAHALLRLPLSDIQLSSGAIEGVAPAGLDEGDRDIEEIFKLAETRQNYQGFDWARFGAEASFLAADERRRTDPKKAGLVESRIRPKPSPVVAASAPPVLSRVLLRARSGPELIRPIELPLPVARNRLKLLGKRRGKNEFSVSAAKAYLTKDGRVEIMQHAESVLASINAKLGVSPESAAARRNLIDNADRILWDLANNNGSGIRGSADIANLEALVMMKGRPAIKITDGVFDQNSLKGSDWEGDFAIEPDQLKEMAGAVGRIDIDGDHVGTGFVVGDGLIMTNRHVAEAVADQVGNKWILQDDVTINFDDRGEGDEKRFEIKSLIYAGADPISDAVNFAHLDLAIFEVETSNAAKTKFPSRMSLSKSTKKPKTKDVIVVGYPARPDMAAIEDPTTHEASMAIAKRLSEIFGLDYGRKYLAPGRIDMTVGTVPSDTAAWVFTHDCTTLAGNSGSMVSSFDADFPVTGLHFAGRTLTANFAHALSAVRASEKMPPDLVERLNWV
ncbi:serine protease [Bradyrhizobium sp. S3.2.6]|uniref:S8 family serine peptidase n=1 Tax=Bradyrhizobium sp. S3.2.6 TaxID=3156428 RepID=UPI0033993C31